MCSVASSEGSRLRTVGLCDKGGHRDAFSNLNESGTRSTVRLGSLLTEPRAK